VAAPHLIVGHIGVMKRDLGATVSAARSVIVTTVSRPRVASDTHVLDRAAAIETDEAAVVRPRPTLVLDHVVEEAVDDGIDDDALDAEPESAGTLRVEPRRTLRRPSRGSCGKP
jgi:hypothetical protein